MGYPVNLQNALSLFVSSLPSPLFYTISALLPLYLSFLFFLLCFPSSLSFLSFLSPSVSQWLTLPHLTPSAPIASWKDKNIIPVETDG
mgnify:CR=1 FL=1